MNVPPQRLAPVPVGHTLPPIDCGNIEELDTMTIASICIDLPGSPRAIDAL